MISLFGKGSWRWWSLAGLIAVVLLAAFALTNARGGEPAVERVFTLNVTGLPSDLPNNANIGGVNRLLFGTGYRAGISLGKISGPGTYEITVPPEFDTIGIGFISFPYSRYVPSQRFHAVKKAPPQLEIDFVQQYYLDIGVSSRSMRGSSPVGFPVEATPEGDGRWYNVGTPVSIEPKGGGLRLAWWAITWKEWDSTFNSGNSTEVIYSTDNPLQLVMDRPVVILTALIDQWERLPAKDPEQQGIAITQLTDGQTVRLISNGQVIAETRHWWQATNVSTAILPIPRDQTVSGYFQITAPDGVTVVFESPVYDDLTSQDMFVF